IAGFAAVPGFARCAGSPGSAGTRGSPGVGRYDEVGRGQAVVDLLEIGDDLIELLLREGAGVAVLALRVAGRQDVAQRGRRAVVQVRGCLPDAQQGRGVDALELSTQPAP